MKFAFTQADSNDLIFLLKPTDKLVGILTGSHSVYVLGKGYFYEKLGIIIDKSCSGFNFWLLSFLLFTYSALRHSYKVVSKILTIPISLIAAYLLTIFVNTSRIFVSIVVHTQMSNNIFENKQHIVHEAIGVITNLTFLILAYLLIEKLLKKQLDEKPAKP